MSDKPRLRFSENTVMFTAPVGGNLILTRELSRLWQEYINLNTSRIYGHGIPDNVIFSGGSI